VPAVIEAGLWGLLGGLALLAGAGIALVVDVPGRVVGAVMAFGAGVLISAASFDLTAEAFVTGGADAASGGLAAGALTFFVVSRAVKGGGAVPIVVGAILDGIPESAAIGLSVLDPGGVSTAVVVAVFVSNIPESLSSTAELRRNHSAAWLLTLWGVVAVVCALSAAIGYGALDGADEDLLGFVNAFAAGAIITMLADSMIPEAFEHEKRSLATGLLVTLGFAVAALLSANGA
jgi:zinc transporter, ZIP family